MDKSLKRVARIIMSLVFLSSSIGKIRNAALFQKSIERTFPNVRVRTALGIAVPTWEAVLALLVLASRPTVAVGSSLATLLGFSSYLIRKRTIRDETPCYCFGALMESTSLTKGLVRNGLLMVISFLMNPNLIRKSGLTNVQLTRIRPFDIIIGAISIGSAVVAVLSLRELGRFISNGPASDITISEVRGADLSSAVLTNPDGKEILLPSIICGGQVKSFTFVSSPCSACSKILANQRNVEDFNGNSRIIVYIGSLIEARAYFGRYGVTGYYVTDSHQLVRDVSIEFVPSTLNVSNEGEIVSNWLTESL